MIVLQSGVRRSGKSAVSLPRKATPRPLGLQADNSVKGLLLYRSLHRARARQVDDHQEASCSRALRTLNTICPYYTMFPLDFPLRRLRPARENEWVLDPFCGRGTTIFAARLRGLRSVGIDSNPVAAAIAAAKLASATPNALIARARAIVDSSRDPSAIPDGPFWRLAFHRETLHNICLLREHFARSCASDDEIALRALVLGILHGPMQVGAPTYLSNQMPRTYATKPDAAVRFWRNHGLRRPPRVDVLDAISRRALHTFATIPGPISGEVHLGDARSVHKLLPRSRRFSWVITSPPYFGMRTYRPDQWLRNWFLGGEPRVDYGQDGELSHRAEKFVGELAAVWASVARRCEPGARLIVRFGALPSIPVDARELLRASFHEAAVGWRVKRWASAGSSALGKRQAQQFGRCSKAAVTEIDACARLEA